LNEILQGIDPDVVHVHHTVIAVATSILRIFRRFNLLITAHNSFDHLTPIQKVGYTFSYFMADQVICNSNKTCKSLPRLIINSKKKIIYNGVNFDKIDKKFNITQNKNYLFTIGTACRMIPQKDLDTLIQGFAYFLNRIDSKEVQLRLIGEGFEKERLEQMVEKLGISDWVMFTGEVSRQEVYAEMQNFDVFVVSSRWEGFCNAMVEAAASGNPIVASNIEPLPEVIGKDNALFFPVGDEKALGEHLTKLFNNSELRQNLANKGKAYVRSRYSLKKSAETYFETYLNFIN
jgi:glycosyltransferase involved in cell wall biosynthesis